MPLPQAQTTRSLRFRVQREAASAMYRSITPSTWVIEPPDAGLDLAAKNELLDPADFIGAEGQRRLARPS